MNTKKKLRIISAIKYVDCGKQIQIPQARNIIIEEVNSLIMVHFPISKRSSIKMVFQEWPDLEERCKGTVIEGAFLGFDAMSMNENSMLTYFDGKNTQIVVFIDAILRYEYMLEGEVKKSDLITSKKYKIC